jgi:hypothetical protein
MAILNSGGADGADTVFGECAEQVGHEVRHYAFDGMKTKWGCYLKVLTDEQLHEADPFLKKANFTLKRKFPCSSVYVDNLLRRNYFQIKDTRAVYAAAPLGKVVEGGTGWAVQMAIDQYVMLIYLFDLKTNKWMQWGGNKFHEILSIDMIRPVDLTSAVYTGIGSRKLTSHGELAIRGLYA